MFRRNRIFIFGVYEGYRESTSGLVSGNVPTAKLRAQMLAAVPTFSTILSTFPLPNIPRRWPKGLGHDFGTSLDHPSALKWCTTPGALEPLAGRFAFLLFVCGIVATGLLAVPVLAASACYGVGEACRWKTSLERKPGEAVRFYAAITIATLTGLSLNFLHIDPVKALFWAAILNGIVAAPLMAVIMTMASSQKVMGKLVIPAYLKWVGWLATAVMLCACIGVFFFTWK